MQYCHIRVGGRNGSSYNAMKTRRGDKLCCTLVSWQRHAANGVAYLTGLVDLLQLEISGYKASTGISRSVPYSGGPSFKYCHGAVGVAEICRGFSQFIHANSRMTVEVMLQPFPATSFQIHYQLTCHHSTVWDNYSVAKQTTNKITELMTPNDAKDSVYTSQKTTCHTQTLTT
jgi:hypothetical protein